MKFAYIYIYIYINMKFPELSHCVNVNAINLEVNSCEFGYQRTWRRWQMKEQVKKKRDEKTRKERANEVTVKVT